MITQKELKAHDVREMMQETAQEHLAVAVSGSKSSTAMLYDVLMKAASEGISIDAACRDLENTVSANSVRTLLNEQLPKAELAAQEKAMNEALAARLPAQLTQYGLEAAIDEHDEPFYGKDEELLEYTCRSRAKAGTTRFFRIITLYVMYRQMRLTVAVAFVLPTDDTVAIVQKLLARSRALKLRLDVLYLDRGFCNTAVIAHLKQVKQPAVLACTIRGKDGGTRQLCRGRKSYRTQYTFTSGLTVEMAVVATLVPGKDKKRRRKWLLFVLVGLDWKPATVYRRYRSRFGIESSYRILRRVRVKTTSRNPALRFFLLGFALLLVNLWAVLRWSVARIPGPGPQRVDPLLFQFQAFVCLLRRAVEQIYGVVMSVSLPVPPNL
jgi:Transposase DDE domain